MTIAIASGKGGTGKTTVTLALADSFSGITEVHIRDCDVEEPNVHLFMEPRNPTTTESLAMIPLVDPSRCSACGACVAACRFGALALAGARVMVFPELCHGCGTCLRPCPEGAIHETGWPMGTISAGRVNPGELLWGTLSIGRAMAPPLIRNVRNFAPPRGEALVLVDCPPGTSCSMMAAVKGADGVILVTEPTPFGLHDLALAVETVALQGIPAGVIINRSGAGDALVEDWCRTAGIPVLMKIPDDPEVARGICRGRTLVDMQPLRAPAFRALVQTFRSRVPRSLPPGKRLPPLTVHREPVEAIGTRGIAAPGSGRSTPPPLRELVLLSGKGGTGKTSLAASLAIMARSAVIADCDVDAADLHLLLRPRLSARHSFDSGLTAIPTDSVCLACGACVEACRFGAIAIREGKAILAPLDCEGCGSCADACVRHRWAMVPRHCGNWFVSDTRAGTMVHARLDIGAENSGKLASLVRREARRIAECQEVEWIISDGPPGTGCAAMASLTGADAALVVAEASISGVHDLERVAGLVRHFGVPLFTCASRADLDQESCRAIEEMTLRSGGTFLGAISRDPSFGESQRKGLTVAEAGSPGARQQTGALWQGLVKHMGAAPRKGD